MDYKLKFQYRLYQNQFKQPLQTSHGVWQIREGIIVSLNSASNRARGEIAPLPWFGSETLAQAVEFCQQLQGYITYEQIRAIPDRLPCCQFALESAYLELTQAQSCGANFKNFCYLLPAGAKALDAWQKIEIDTINPTFKWKIGVLPLAEEIKILQRLISSLPTTAKLRLDANGGLSLNRARQLLTVCDRYPQIEFVEQPLPTECLNDIFQLSQEYSTLLALDESVASFQQLQSAHQQGWQGIYVIKAAIMGFPSRLTQFCQDNNIDFVFSSVFETEVARQAVLNIARQLNHPRAIGFGVRHLYSHTSL